MSAELKKLCKFYKGEETCPKGTDPTIWELEKEWCELSDTDEGQAILGGYVSDYIAYGLGDFGLTGGVPITLKALLFVRLTKDAWSVKESVPDFKKWYTETYLGNQ